MENLIKEATLDPFVLLHYHTSKHKYNLQHSPCADSQTKSASHFPVHPAATVLNGHSENVPVLLSGLSFAPVQ